MKNLRSFLLLLLFSTGTVQLFAHALWIETPGTGKKGQPQEVKIFYGEYASNEREQLSEWYSDVKEFTLWLTAPGKEKVQLSKTPGADFYSASFIPEQDGVYLLTVSHVAKDLGGTTKYEFSSVAAVAVGKTSVVDHRSIPNTINVLAGEARTYKMNATVQLKAVLNGQPLANKPVSVFSPEGWSKEFITDANGHVAFTPLWPGRYVLELSNFEKTTGTHNGQTYTAAWQGATSSLEVSK
ncbi:MAG: DUF4198 domain-containing protein [Arcticibacter sp.]